MGWIMKEDDVFIGSLLELMNLRFAPIQGTEETEQFGGIDEIVALQKEFEIFRRGRPLAQSVSALNVGGFWNLRTKNRWHKLLHDLPSYTTDRDGENGDQRIVGAIIDNLAAEHPLPVYFTAHDSRHEPPGRRVTVSVGRPLFYLEQDYLIVSLPMKPR